MYLVLNIWDCFNEKILKLSTKTIFECHSKKIGTHFLCSRCTYVLEYNMEDKFNKTKFTTYWMTRKKNKIHVKNKLVYITFQEALKTTLLIGQIFGLIPVGGILERNVKNVRFKFLSWRCLYALISIAGQAFVTLICFYRALVKDGSMEAGTYVVFYLSSCVTSAMYLYVASKWPVLAQQVAATEDIDPNTDTTLKLKCNATCAIILFMAFIEHVLSLLAAFVKSQNCYPHAPWHRAFVESSYPFVFDYMAYSITLGIIIQVINFQSTFVWNYSDLFVICISHYLTSRLDQINVRLRTAREKYLLDPFWRVTREDYSRVARLVRMVDAIIGGVVFICFFNNLFFICLQLFHILEDGVKGTQTCGGKTQGKGLLGGYEYPVYFVFSLTFLISRSVAVSLLAARVHAASQSPASVLYEVPSAVYSVEVQRFLDQVNGDNVALTGLQFFSVTRGLLLNMAGTIITYELVLVQFNDPTSTPTAAPADMNTTTK